MSHNDQVHRYFEHETAIVESGAEIGDGTKVWHHAHVRSGARIGSGCVIGKNVFVDTGAVVGDRSKIQNNVSIYSGVHLGDGVFVGPSAVFTNDLHPRAESTSWELIETFVESGASIGANATVVCGKPIGHHAMIAAGSVVTREVAAHQLVAGNPARHLGWVCWCGKIVSRDETEPTAPICAEHGAVSFDCVQ